MLFNFLVFISFLEDFFLSTIITHTHTHDPRPLPTTYDLRHLATLGLMSESQQGPEICDVISARRDYLGDYSRVIEKTARMLNSKNNVKCMPGIMNFKNGVLTLFTILM